MSDERPESEPSTEADELVVRAKTDRAAFSLLYERYYPSGFQVLSQATARSRCCRGRPFRRVLAGSVASSDVFRPDRYRFPPLAVPDRNQCDQRPSAAVSSPARTLGGGRAERALEPQRRSAPLLAENDTRDWPAVYQALMELDERDRTIVMLRFFADCSHEEIASCCGCHAWCGSNGPQSNSRRLREKFKLAVATDPTLGTPPKVDVCLNSTNTNQNFPSFCESCRSMTLRAPNMAMPCASRFCASSIRQERRRRRPDRGSTPLTHGEN